MLSCDREFPPRCRLLEKHHCEAAARRRSRQLSQDTKGHATVVIEVLFFYYCFAKRRALKVFKGHKSLRDCREQKLHNRKWSTRECVVYTGRHIVLIFCFCFFFPLFPLASFSTETFSGRAVTTASSLRSRHRATSAETLLSKGELRRRTSGKSIL